MAGHLRPTSSAQTSGVQSQGQVADEGGGVVDMGAKNGCARPATVVTGLKISRTLRSVHSEPESSALGFPSSAQRCARQQHGGGVNQNPTKRRIWRQTAKFGCFLCDSVSQWRWQRSCASTSTVRCASTDAGANEGVLPPEHLLPPLGSLVDSLEFFPVRAKASLRKPS